jgi:4'-phosphopantetheinyl transferase
MGEATNGVTQIDSAASFDTLSPAGIVEVWKLPLQLDPDLQAELSPLLSSDEKERAAKFRFALHRGRYICCRALLRLVLADYTGVSPAEIGFEYGAQGKPELIKRSAQLPLHFNVSHCEDVAVLAVAREFTVGIDIERIRALRDFDELVNRFFSEPEAQGFAKLSEAMKPEAFFNLWTRKEAWLKATGEGIGHRLREVEVSFLTSEQPEFRKLPELERPCSSERWKLFSFSPARGYVCAVAAAHANSQIRRRSLRTIFEISTVALAA